MKLPVQHAPIFTCVHCLQQMACGFLAHSNADLHEQILQTQAVSYRIGITGVTDAYPWGVGGLAPVSSMASHEAQDVLEFLTSPQEC